jgi:predicted site-specific integrase-resolvase
MSTEILKDFIPRADLAAELDVNEKTLVRWDRDGKGPPATRLGRKVLYFRPTVEKWLRAQEEARTSATAA